VQFFADLGIPDLQKRVFLGGLLRTFRDAAAKLDMHLGGYSSAVHAAVSRLSSPPNPRKSPEHLWRRVHDRLGFFHDENQHAQRLVNVGMSWAYWHLEMNAICLASAQLLTEQSRLTDRAADDHGRVDAGSVVALAGAPRPPCDDPTDDHANSLAIAAGGASAGPPRAPDCQDNCDSDGGGDAEGGAGFNEEYVLSKVFERQLSLKPSVTAVTVIKSLVALLTGRDDSPDVCRRLLTDSLLLFTRNHHSSASDKEAATEMLWTRLGTVLSKWWAVWEAPGNAPSVPPPGTAAHKRFAGQPTKSSRWCYSVDMTDANEILAASGVPDSRFFHKSKLSTVEEVERTAPKDKPRLPVAVATMMLMATKHEDNASAVNELMVLGRGEQAKNAPLAAAFCQAFHTAGLVQLAAASAPPPPSTGGRIVAGPVEASAKVGAAAPFSVGQNPNEGLYAAVEVKRKVTWLHQTKQNRAVRRDVRRATSRAQPGQGAQLDGVAPRTRRPPLVISHGAMPPSSVTQEDRLGTRPFADGHTALGSDLPPPLYVDHRAAKRARVDPRVRSDVKWATHFDHVGHVAAPSLLNAHDASLPHGPIPFVQSPYAPTRHWEQPATGTQAPLHPSLNVPATHLAPSLPSSFIASGVKERAVPCPPTQEDRDTQSC